jgi:isopentenyl phosphate kinase
MVIDVLNQGFVPVLHGDCIFDLTKGCVVLSGDTIIKVHIHDSTDLSVHLLGTLRKYKKM